jgi:AAA domain
MHVDKFFVGSMRGMSCGPEKHEAAREGEPMLDYNAALIEALSDVEDRIAARDLRERETEAAWEPDLLRDLLLEREAEFAWEPDVDLLRDLLLEREAELEIERQSAQLPPRSNNGGDANPEYEPHPSDKANRIVPEPTSDIDTRTVTVTFFPNKSAQTQRCIELTLPQLAEQIRLETGPSKLELPWLKLMVFGNTRSPRGCLRTNANAKELTGIEVEHDQGEVTLDTAIAILRTVRLRALAYTSPSYVPASKEKWRIILPVSTNLPLEMRALLVARVNGLFGGKLAPESFVLSQAYLYGRVNDNPAHRVEVIDGDFIDLRTNLDPSAIGKSSTDKGIRHGVPSGSPSIEIAEAFKKLELKNLGEGIKLPEFLPQPFAPIKAECGWLRHVHDTGGSDQSEILWRDALRVCMFLEQGEDLIHEFSSKHAEYDIEKTKAKFARARKDKKTNDLGYPKCQTICNHGSTQCEKCPHLALGKSPLNLALQQSTEPPLAPIACDPAELRVSYSNVRHRPWLYGTYLMRGEVTIIAAPGGVGKTALTTGIATAIATGTVLMDDKIWGDKLKVLSINGEDGKEEVTRRMWAFARAHAHQIAVAAPARFYAIGAEDDRVQRMAFLRTNERNTSTLDTAGFAILESALDAICPDVVMLDPFVVFCSGGNMNDGPVMAQVMRKLKSLAIKYDCSILVVHHNRKGGERDNQESISGAAAIVNLARCALMPVPMTAEETKEFGVLPSERHRYFRLVNAKPNFTPKSEDSPWYQLHSIEIPNPEPPLYEYGDNVQAVARVSLPLPKTAAEAAENEKVQHAILDLVGRGKLIDDVRYPYSANVTGAKNMRALLDDAMAAVRDATPLRPWHSDDLRALVHAAIDKMKVEGQLFEGTIGKGRFHGSSALYAKRSNPTSPASDGTPADTPEEEHEGPEDGA